MPDSFFQVLQEPTHPPDLSRYRATAATTGPWSADVQHGGPPCALLVRAAERAARASGTVETVETVEPTGGDAVAVRLAAEFLRPVPVSAVDVSAFVVRATRTVMLVDAVLRADGRDCLRAHVWLSRRRHLDTPSSGGARRPSHPVPTELPRFDLLSFPYAEHVDWRTVSGARHAAELGPAVVWARPLVPLLPGETMSSLQRCAVVGDSASGISAELPWAHWSFPNIDLDLHLLRQVAGDWVGLDAATQVGSEGIALARSTLFDLGGVVGVGLQTLVLRRRLRATDEPPGSADR